MSFLGNIYELVRGNSGSYNYRVDSAGDRIEDLERTDLSDECYRDIVSALGEGIISPEKAVEMAEKKAIGSRHGALASQLGVDLG